MTKHWKISGTRDGNPIRLYVSTTDEVISEDLACGPRFSLTLMGHQDNYRQNPRKDSALPDAHDAWRTCRDSPTENLNSKHTK